MAWGEIPEPLKEFAVAAGSRKQEYGIPCEELPEALRGVRGGHRASIEVRLPPPEDPWPSMAYARRTWRASGLVSATFGLA
jgi:hypothetical protein